LHKQQIKGKDDTENSG